MNRRSSILALAAACFCLLRVYAQQSREPIRTSGLTVVVDAVVTDEKNRVVADLTAGDFVVFEDDVEQQIDNFEFRRLKPAASESVSLPQGAASTLRGDHSTLSFQAWRPEEQGNLIIFLLDYATTQFENQKLVQEASIEYVRENLQARDYVAIFALSSGFHCLQDFTSDREKLAAALQWRDIAGNVLAGATSVADLSVADSLRLAEPQTAGVAADSTQGLAQAAETAGRELMIQAQLSLARRIQMVFETMMSFVRKREARSVLTAIQAISKGVTEIPGRKTLILFSQGFVIGPHMESELEKTVNVANRANLAIYGIDAQGLMTGQMSGELIPKSELDSIHAAHGRSRIYASGGESLFDRARQVGSDVRDSTLRYISAATGGFAVRHTNDLHVAMKRIDEDIRSYYLLSYRPDRQELEGTFRTIRLEVKREGLKVRARTGYLAIPAGMEMVTAEEFRLLKAAWNGKLAFELPAYFRLDTFPGNENRKNVLLTLEVPSSALQFQSTPENIETKERFSAQLELIGLIRDSSGQVLLRFGTPVNLHATQAEYEALKEGTISFSNTLQLAPGNYSFQILVQDLQTKKAALLEQGLRVPQPAQALALSSIVLGKTVEPSNEESDFLTIAGAKILPSAQRRFRNAEKLVFFFEIDNFLRSPETGRPKVAVRVSIARGGSPPDRSIFEEVLSTSQSDAAFPHLSVSKYVELQGLQPGPYFFVVEVNDQLAGANSQTRTPFYILP